MRQSPFGKCDTMVRIAAPTGGAITVKSERGKGASFKVYLPAVVQESRSDS